MCVGFIALAAVIFMLPTQQLVTVRSSFDIGVVNEKQDPIEAPDQVAKRITGVYASAALQAMEKKGTPLSVLSALQGSSAEDIGRTVIMISTIDARAESAATEFQQNIADQIIKGEAPRVQLLAEASAARVASAKQASDKLKQQIDALVEEIGRLGMLRDDLRRGIESQRAALAALYQRSGTDLQSIDRSAADLSEQIWGQTLLMSSLTLERSNLSRDLMSMSDRYEALLKAFADAELQQKMFSESRVSLPPHAMPAAIISRRPRLLFVAFVVSILIAFGTVVLIHNIAEK
jgi:tetrahydromethanopterin S-methyltransferase subunit B